MSKLITSGVVACTSKYNGLNSPMFSEIEIEMGMTDFPFLQMLVRLCNFSK